MSHLNQKLYSIILKLKKKNKILLIGIKWPTADGKTNAGDDLAKRLEKKFNIFIFRLDWTLKKKNLI